MDSTSTKEVERIRINTFKENITEKKRTDSRNDQLNYRRKRAIAPVQIKQLSQENINIEMSIDEESADLIEAKIKEFKENITSPSSEEELWKILLTFETLVSKESSINLRNSLATDFSLHNSLLLLSQNPSLSDECQIGALQALSELTNSFKTLAQLGSEAERTVFSTYLRVLNSNKNRKTFAAVLRGIARLILDNKEANEYFINKGFYEQVLQFFEQMIQETSLDNTDSLKNVCVIINGLSQSKLPLKYACPQLGYVIEYLMSSSDSDLQFDISSTFCNIAKSFGSIYNYQWVRQQLAELYSFNLMKAINMFISQKDVWIPVRGCQILSSISRIRHDEIRGDFRKEIHSKGVLDLLVKIVKTSNCKVVLKYHVFMSIRDLVERDCLEISCFSQLIEHLLDPVIQPNSQMDILTMEIFWEMLKKKIGDSFFIASDNMIRMICTVLKDQDTDIQIKCLDVLDYLMKQFVQNSSLKKHSKILKQHNFNQIIHQLQSSKSEEVQMKAVSVVSHLDSDEDSDSNGSQKDIEEELD